MAFKLYFLKERVRMAGLAAQSRSSQHGLSEYAIHCIFFFSTDHACRYCSAHEGWPLQGL